MKPRSVVLASMGVAIVCVLAWKIGAVIHEDNASWEVTKRQLQTIAEASEVAACHRAGYERPNWRLEGYEEGHGRIFSFTCEDERGRIFPVVLPACNTNCMEPQNAHRFTDACRALLPAASR